MKRSLLLCLCASVASARLASSQCPDGTPPPCRGRAAAPRREPLLDDRTWLILPFENTAGAADAEMLRQASVNLLYQELSRWSDVRVISDDRVADLLRDVPAAAQARWGLTTGLDVARRAGAGRLVLGDFLALGGSAQVAARVYEVRSGRLVRTVRDRLAGLQSPAGLDSLTSTFGRLARSAINVPVPPGTRSSSVGTNSLAAYAEYAAGMTLYRSGFADSALPRFQRALQLDSAFALPGMRLLEMNVQDAPRYLEVAARAADRLPPRERALLSAYRAVVNNDWDRVCEMGDTLLARDSADAEAWFIAGACQEDDLVVEGPGGPRFARSLNRAFAYYRRALELDPGQPIVFTRLVANLDATGPRTGCTVRRAPCPLEDRRVGTLVVQGDSLATIVGPPGRAAARAPRRTREFLEQARWRWEHRRQFLVRFVEANPRSWPAHASLARALLQLGDLTGAEREYDAAAYAVHLPGDRRLYYRDRIELALRQERPTLAAGYLDSMLADTTTAQQPQYATVFGRFSRDQAVVAESLRAEVYPARAAWVPALAGILPDRFDSIETRFARVALPRTAVTNSGLLRLSTIVAFHARRTGPALDTSEAEHPLVRFQGFFARGDTARARTILDSVTVSIAALPPYAFDDAQWVIGAESWLELGDSARALVLMQDWARRWPTFHHNVGTLLEQGVGLTSSARLFPRGWLLLGDLSMAAGRREDARRAYRMVLGMWEGGEAPVQPMVTRVRAALARLGS